jgi:hypothetical protein
MTSAFGSRFFVRQSSEERGCSVPPRTCGPSNALRVPDSEPRLTMLIGKSLPPLPAGPSNSSTALYGQAGVIDPLPVHAHLNVGAGATRRHGNRCVHLHSIGNILPQSRKAISQGTANKRRVTAPFTELCLPFGPKESVRPRARQSFGIMVLASLTPLFVAPTRIPGIGETFPRLTSAAWPS